MHGYGNAYGAYYARVSAENFKFGGTGNGTCFGVSTSVGVGYGRSDRGSN